MGCNSAMIPTRRVDSEHQDQSTSNLGLELHGISLATAGRCCDSRVAIYHAPRVGGGTTGGNLVNNQPANRSFSIDFGNINQLANLTGTAITRPSNINAVELNSKTPTIYNFTLGVQREIGFKTVLEVSYVGSFARHLGQRININDIPDGAKLGANNISPVTGSRLPDEFLRPYRGYGDITMVTWAGTSNYNSLQVQANRRYTRGFQAGLAYTYSKSFDYANDDSSDVFFGRPFKAFNYAPSDFDQTHILTLNYIYDVPGAQSSLWQQWFRFRRTGQLADFRHDFLCEWQAEKSLRHLFEHRGRDFARSTVPGRFECYCHYRNDPNLYADH